MTPTTRRRQRPPADPGETAGPLPHFVVVGAMKAGTTSLLLNLRRHPEVFMPGREVHFFDKNWERGVGWYREQFVRGDDKVRGEKTPSYMTKHEYMARLGDVLPDAKIIALLREPVARLLSHINHRIQKGRLPTPELIDMDFVRRHILPNDKAYVSRGRYLDQILTNILPYFDRDRLFVRATDGWSAGVDRASLADVPDAKESKRKGVERSDFTRQLMHDLQDFLGISRHDAAAYKVVGVREYRAQVADDVRDHLRELYAEPNKRLFEFLGYDIPEWTRPA